MPALYTQSHMASSGFCRLFGRMVVHLKRSVEYPNRFKHIAHSFAYLRSVNSSTAVELILGEPKKSLFKCATSLSSGIINKILPFK